MNKTEAMQEKLARISSKLSSNIYIMAIRDSMLAYVPFTFIASIFLILAFIPSQGINDFISNTIGVEYAVWQGKLLIVYSASLAIGGLLVLIAMSKTMADYLNLNQIQVILTSLVAYLTLTPSVMSDAGPSFSQASMSAQSMFFAMLLAIGGSKLYKLIDDLGLKIKMPASVPPAVSAPFESLIPSFIVITIAFILRLVLDGFGTDAVSAINGTLGLPLLLIGGSLFGTIFVAAFQQLLWFFGVHGSSIVQGVMLPIWQVLEDQNKAATMAGEAAQNIINYSFFTHFASIGVVGAVIAALIVARSKQYREISKIAIVPYAFNVGEPALFGFPLMMNFTLFIPFIATNAISAIISYIAFATGLVPIPLGLVQLPWTTPIIFSGFAVTGSIAGAVLQLVCVVASTLVWMPFIKMADKQNLQVEAGNEEAAEEAA